MSENDQQIPSAVTTATHRPVLERKTILSNRRLIGVCVVLVSIALGLILPFLPEMGQLVLLALIPAIVVCTIILMNPYVGIFMFYFYVFLRPYDFIPALLPLRLTLVIEVLTLLSWIISIAIHQHKIKWHPAAWLFAGFVGVISITVTTAETYYYAYQVWEELIVLFLIFVIATNVVTSLKRLDRIIWVMLLIHAYFAFKGISTFVTGSFQTAGGYTSGRVGSAYIGDENDFAMIMNTMIPFAFFGFFYLRGKLKLLSGALLVLFILAVASSFSRGGFVGLAAVLFYCVMSLRRKVAAIAVMIFLGLTLVMFAPSSYWEEASTITEVNQGTAGKRIGFWKAAVGMWLDYPILGVGAGNGGAHMPRYLEGYENPYTQWGRAFHGTLPQVLAETGTVGIILYLGLMFMIARRLWRIRSRQPRGDTEVYPVYLASALLGSIIAFMASGTFLSVAFYPHIWTTYTFATILFLCLDTEKVSRQANTADSIKEAIPATSSQ